MASQQPPPPPMKKKSPPAAPTSICDLGEDLLREVFLGLPSLPSLVRASLTCTPFLRAVRSSPKFRRRFRDLHSPPLLGVFVKIHDPAMPAFAPTRRRSDVDHAAAIRGADVFLTLLPEDGDKDPDREWSMEDCRNGYAVLVNWRIEQMAVYDPLTRALDLFPVPPKEIYSENYVEFHMLASEECHGQFRIVAVGHEEWWAQAANFSSATREWQVFPVSEDGKCSNGGTMVKGLVYWTFASGTNIRVLNTTTLQFSEIDLPLHMEGQGEFKPGETKDGRLCLVGSVKHTLVVWIRRPDDYGVDTWILDKTFPLTLDDDVTLNVVAITGGLVYFSTSSESLTYACFFMSFCLDTEKLNELCPVSHFYVRSFPYIMGFLPSVCNKVNLQLEGS